MKSKYCRNYGVASRYMEWAEEYTWRRWERSESFGEELVQEWLFCQFHFSDSPHIVFVATWKITSKEAFSCHHCGFSFVVVFDAAVFAFLLGVEFCQSRIKQLMVCLSMGVAVLDIQTGCASGLHFLRSRYDGLWTTTPSPDIALILFVYGFTS